MINILLFRRVYFIHVARIAERNVLDDLFGKRQIKYDNEIGFL